MQRRSTRTQNGTYTEPPDLYVANDEIDSGGDDEFVAPVKKARTRKRKAPEEKDAKDDTKPVKRPRGKRGLLKDLVEMPIDILFEIFGKLNPLDLVHIARTTRGLRAILMDRSSKSIWRSARSNIEALPDCPNDLSEAQYAILAFSKNCSFCQKKTAIIHVAWSCRVRCCNKCLQQKQNFKEIGSGRQFWTEHCKYPTLLASWVPLLKVVRHTARRREVVSWYALSEVDRQWAQEYEALETPQSKYDWVYQRLGERYAIEKHVQECELWIKKYSHFPVDEDLFRNVHLDFERKLEVAEYIKKLGFGDELYKINPMVDSHPLEEEYVKDACMHPLTDAVLLRLKPRLLNRMEELKTQRECAELKFLIAARRPFLSDIRIKGSQGLPLNSIYPNVRDIHEIAEKHGFIDYSKSPADALSVPFAEVVALWQANIDSKLINLITSACEPDFAFDRSKVFSLATVSFECTECNEMSLRHERVLVHSCTTATPWRYLMNPPDPLTVRQRVLQSVFNAAEWCSNNPDMISFRKVGWETMVRVVEMAGLDPKTATAADMDELNPIFECRSCNDIDLGRWTMTWAAVKKHELLGHKNSTIPMNLQLLSDPEASTARERIREEQMRTAHKEPCLLICTHCREEMTSVAKYRSHLKEKHAITKVAYSELAFAPDQSRIPPAYRLWPPLDIDEPEISIEGNVNERDGSHEGGEPDTHMAVENPDDSVSAADD